MPNYTCPSCRQPFVDSENPDAPCVYCGHRLSEFAVPHHFHQGSFDLVGIARGQRWVIYSAIFALGVQAFFIFGWSIVFRGWPITFFTLLPTLWLVVGIVRLMVALDEKHDKAFVSGLAMFVPIVNILVIIGLNLRAVHIFRDAGLEVGLLGVKHDRVLQSLDPTKCRTCGYDLTGNRSGRCSECGTYIEKR